MMLRRVLWTFTFCTAFAGGLHAQGPATPAGKKLDLTYVPSEATAVLVAHPHRVLTAAQAKWWPTEIISAYGKKELGFDPLEVEQVMLIFGAMNGGPMDSVGVVVRFQKPVDVERVGKKIARGGKEEKIEGHLGWLAPNDFQPSVAFPNERTAVVSTKGYLPQLLTAKPGDGPLQKLLTAADDSASVTFYLTFEPIRPLLAAVLEMLADEDLGPEGNPFKDVAELPMAVDTVQVAANFKPAGDGLLFDVKLGTRDADAAKFVVDAIKRVFKQSQALIMEQISAGMNDENSEELEVKVASMKYVERIADGILASLDPKAKGSEVTMSAEVQIGPVQLAYLATTFVAPIFESRNVGVGVAEAIPNAAQNNLKEIGLAFHNHLDKHKTFPAAASFDKEGKPLLSWRVHILPFVEGGAELYKEFHLDEPWDSEHNKKLIEKMPAVFKHPQFDEAGKTVYLAVVGKGAAFDGKEGGQIQAFTDGTSMTIMVVEVAAEKAVPWTKPEDWAFDPAKEIDGRDFGRLGGNDFFNALFADGHVEAYISEFDMETLKKMFTRAGGEIVGAIAPAPITAPPPMLDPDPM